MNCIIYMVIFDFLKTYDSTHMVREQSHLAGIVEEAPTPTPNPDPPIAIDGPVAFCQQYHQKLELFLAVSYEGQPCIEILKHMHMHMYSSD